MNKLITSEITVNITCGEEVHYVSQNNITFVFPLIGKQSIINFKDHNIT